MNCARTAVEADGAPSVAKRVPPTMAKTGEYTYRHIIYIYIYMQVRRFSWFTTGAKRGYPTLLLLLRGRAPHGAASVQTTASECRRLRYMCVVATDLDYAAARRRRPCSIYIYNIYNIYIYLNVRSSGAQIASETCHFPYTGAYIPVAVSATTTTTTALHINTPIRILYMCVDKRARLIMYGKNEIVPIYYVGMRNALCVRSTHY
jgi:hypothetical protein